MFILKTVDEVTQITKEITKIGRHTDNDIVINSHKASRFHCEVIVINGRLFLKDVNSVNGTFIGEKRILPDREILLKVGDKIGIGFKAGDIATHTIRVEQTSDVQQETPPNEENEVVSTTNDSDSDQNLINDPEENSDVSPLFADLLQRIQNENPRAAVPQTETRSPAPLPVSEPVSRESSSRQSKPSPPAKVKLEPITHSPVRNADVAPLSPALTSNAPNQEGYQLPALANVCIKQPPADDIVETTQHGAQISQNSVVDSSNCGLIAGHSVIQSDDIRNAMLRMVEQFLAEKMSGSNILPFILNMTAHNASTSGCCSTSASSTPVAPKNAPNVPPTGNPAQFQPSTGNPPQFPAHAASGKENSSHPAAVSKDIVENPRLLPIPRVSIKVDLSEEVENDVEEIPDESPVPSPVKVQPAVEPVNTSSTVDRRPSETIINLCDNASEDVIMISDDESGGSRRSRKNRKNIDPNTIVIEDTHDDELSQDLLACSKMPEPVAAPAEPPPKSKPKVSFQQPVTTAPVEPETKSVLPQSAEKGSLEPPTSSKEPTQSNLQPEETGVDDIASFIDLCDDVKPPLVKREALASSSYTNMDAIIELDSDDEDFPMSRLNATQDDDDFGLAKMFGEPDDIKEECADNSWFEQCTQTDMVEGKHVSRRCPVSSTTELDDLEDEVGEPVEQPDGVCETEPERSEPMEVDAPAVDVYRFEEETRTLPKDDVLLKIKADEVKEKYKLKPFSVMLTHAEPLRKRSRKRAKEEEPKRRPSASFGNALMTLDNVAKNKEEPKKVRLPALQSPLKPKARKRRIRSPAISVSEKKLIKEKRKEKLKEIAPSKVCRMEDRGKDVARPEAKPVVKVTDKNRGSFLIDSMIREASAPKREKPAEASTSKGPTHPMEWRIPVIREKATTSNDAKLMDQLMDKYCKESSRRGSASSTEAKVDKVAGAARKEADSRKTETKNREPASGSGDSVTRKVKTARISPKAAKKPLKSSLKKHQVIFGPTDIYARPKEKKRVRFEKETETKEIPGDAQERRNNGIFAPAYKLNESLIREGIFEFETAMAKVCSWNVKWLEEQQKCSDPPPLYPECDQANPNCTLVMKYKEQLKLLMFNNLWKAIFSSWNKPDNDFLPHTQYINEKTSLSTLIINSVDETKVEKKLWTISASRTIPVDDSDNDLLNGQIVILNFPVTQINGGIPKKTMVFGYVAGVTKSPLLDGVSVTQRMLIKVFAKPFRIVLGEAKLKVLNYLRTCLRPFQALAMVTRSPLTNLIVDPEKTFFFEPVFNLSGDWCHDKFLDGYQRKAVANCLNCILSSQPSVCLVNGAPGSGKSQVIVSLMRELFSKNNRSRFPNDLRVIIITAHDVVADDLSYRLDGLNKKEKYFSFLRYGNCRGMRATMKNCTLDKKIQDLMEEDQGNKLINLEEEKNNLRAKIHSIKLVLDSTSAKPEKINEAKIKLINNEREWNDMETENSKILEQMKSQMAKEISIEGADIIITSISSCWSSNFEHDFVPTNFNKGDVHKFTVCIFDDASLINETAMLVPMMLMVRSLILIGDHRNQLTIDKSRSPFCRLLQDCAKKAQSALSSLNYQYRLPPLVLQWVEEYYKTRCAQKQPTPKLRVKEFFLFDLKLPTIEEMYYGYEVQANYCSMLVEKLNQYEDSNARFGIIVAHPQQKDIIRSSNGLFERGRKVIVETLDEFSGREQDVVLLCLPYQCTQYASWLYVAVTRAKCALFVCGDVRRLENHDCVRSLGQFAKSRNLYSRRDSYETDIPTSLILSS